jgi:hypothetical protein
MICSCGPRYQHQTIASVFSGTIRCAHEQLPCPYYLQSVQCLLITHHGWIFFRWFVQQTTNPFFVSSVLFTDEVTYGRDSITNFHNQHQQNPCGAIHDRHQLRLRISVWAGIVGDCLVGSHILPQCLTGNVDRDFLLNGLPQVLELVPLAVRAWFMHDGAPARFSWPV